MPSAEELAAAANAGASQPSSDKPPSAGATTTSTNNTPDSATAPTSTANAITQPVEEWLLVRVGHIPKTSMGWFRCGVAFYNKKEFTKCIECLEKSIQLDPMNYNAHQIMARACIAVNRRQEAIEALKRSVNLDNPADWQLLVELTNELRDEQQLEGEDATLANTGPGRLVA